MPASGDEFEGEPERLPGGRRRSRPRHDPEEVSEDVPGVPLEPGKDLPAAVFMVPNRHWGFEITTSEDHPGACVYYREQSRHATLLKGTDAEHVRFRKAHYFVTPTESNGLSKETGFELVPRHFRLHRIRTYYPQRYLGRLDDAVLQGLRKELARLHPED